MKTILLAAALLLATIAQAQTPVEIKIWPNGAPASNGLTGPETTPAPGRVGNVSAPILYVYPADKAKNTGAAVVIAPGGGYVRLSIEHEGHQAAQWLAENGITGVVLKYRMPNGNPEIPLSDACETMRIVRRHAAEWGVNPAKVGFSGFSAGGHLTAAISTLYDDGARPDFAILYYPAVAMFNRPGIEASPETIARFDPLRHIDAQTPPALIFQSNDDRTCQPVPNAMAYYAELNKNKVPAALYIFPTGGHGWGFNTDFGYHDEMKSLYLKWLKDNKIIE